MCYEFDITFWKFNLFLKLLKMLFLTFELLLQVVRNTRSSVSCKALIIADNLWSVQNLTACSPLAKPFGKLTLSKLKLMKSYLGSTMTVAVVRFSASSIAILPIEIELARNLDYKDIMEVFVKARKHNFFFL